MRILAKAQGIRVSPVIALVLALGLASVLGERALRRSVQGTAGYGASFTTLLRLEVEPALFKGGIVVSRNRHIIAGAAMGCAAGAAVGGGGAAAAGLVSGGLAWAAIPAATGIGCLIGAGAGAALGYPLDSWALTGD